jgi:hypothetical protein
MIRIITTLFIAISLTGCGDSEEITDDTPVVEQVETNFNSRARREVMTKLNIPATEKCEIKVYREHINADTILDAIVTVNRLEFAMDEAIREGKQGKRAEMGFLGNYNFFFYYDGAKDQFSVPIPAPSSPGRPLDISFQNILSPVQKDVIIDYRIRNSGWRSYFSVLNESDLSLVFQWKVFDKAGEDVPEALLHKIVVNPNSFYKDIYIYESQIDDYNKDIADMYKYVPSITKEGKIQYKFTFDERFGKYKLLEGNPGNAIIPRIPKSAKR